MNLDTQAPQIVNAYIADTEEVAAAKAAFFAAFNAVKHTGQDFAEVKIHYIISTLSTILLIIISWKNPSLRFCNDLLLSTTTI